MCLEEKSKIGRRIAAAAVLVVCAWGVLVRGKLAAQLVRSPVVVVGTRRDPIAKSR